MKRGTSPSGKEDRPPCYAYCKGKCNKGDACDYWRPPACKFFKAGNCSEGKKCCFLHPSKENSAAPAPKQQETASSSKDENKDSEAKKAKAKAKPKAQAKVFLRISSPSSTCFTTIQTKKVHFSKFSQKKSIRDEKLPTYIKWDTKIPEFVPTRTNPDGTVIFTTKEEIDFYEEWSRKQALKLWNELHPRKKRKAEDFFVGIDLDLLEPADKKETQAKGDLEQMMHDGCVTTKVDSDEKQQLSPKKTKKTKSVPTPPDKLRSALTG